VLLATPLFAMPQQENALVSQALSAFEARTAFATIGPPLPENAQNMQAETRLFLAMVQRFDEVAYDSDAFAFVAQSFVGAVDSFHPAHLAAVPEPGEAATTSSSVYVDHVRLSVMPSRAVVLPLSQAFLPAQPVAQNGVQPENAPAPPASISAKREKIPQPIKKEGAEKQNAGKPATTPSPTPSIDSPGNTPASVPENPNAETLRALQQAVKDLGLEKKLDFGQNAQSNLSITEKKPPAPSPRQNAPQNAPHNVSKTKALSATKPAPATPAAEVAAEVAGVAAAPAKQSAGH